MPCFLLRASLLALLVVLTSNAALPTVLTDASASHACPMICTAYADPAAAHFDAQLASERAAPREATR